MNGKAAPDAALSAIHLLFAKPMGRDSCAYYIHKTETSKSAGRASPPRPLSFVEQNRWGKPNRPLQPQHPSALRKALRRAPPLCCLRARHWLA